MITDVLLQNKAGWTMEILEQFQGFDGVKSVDGRGLLPNGRFKEALIRFRSPRHAQLFAEIWARETAKKKK